MARFITGYALIAVLLAHDTPAAAVHGGAQQPHFQSTSRAEPGNSRPCDGYWHAGTTVPRLVNATLYLDPQSGGELRGAPPLRLSGSADMETSSVAAPGDRPAALQCIAYEHFLRSAVIARPMAI